MKATLSQAVVNDLLNEIPFEAINNWCNEFLTPNQRKAIYRHNCRDKNYTKFKKCYLYTMEGDLIDMFESREDAGDHIAFLLDKDEISAGYVSSCLRSKRPIYGKFWVTEAFPFDPLVYNNNNIVRSRHHKKKNV